MIDYRIFVWVKICLNSKINLTEFMDYADSKEPAPWELINSDTHARMLFFDALPQEVKDDLNYLENSKVNEYLYHISNYVFAGLLSAPR